VQERERMQREMEAGWRAQLEVRSFTSTRVQILRGRERMPREEEAAAFA
jgi:hypothetical protein